MDVIATKKESPEGIPFLIERVQDLKSRFVINSRFLLISPADMRRKLPRLPRHPGKRSR